MNTSGIGTAKHPIRVEILHEAHPRIRAQDWRSPLVAQLIGGARYSDGTGEFLASFRPAGAGATNSSIHLIWAGLGDDYDLCINTYQRPVLTEFAALAVACILCQYRAGLEITEVTRRGEKVDYWLGDRELLLEVSGTQSGNLENLCASKSTEQLQKNPFRKDGYVCVSRFAEPEARLWFYTFPRRGS